MFFFFKQKTAYEMRISDWSSDVCCSDLGGASRRIVVRDLTCHRWRKEYGGLKTDHARRMKDLEKENGGLRRAISDLTLYKLVAREQPPSARACVVYRQTEVFGFARFWGARRQKIVISHAHEYGRAHVCTPVTNEHTGCRILI